MAMDYPVLDHKLISQRYFMPRSAPFGDPFWVETVDGERLACHYRRTREDAYTVIHFHGNGEVVADYLNDMGPVFDRMGVNLLLAEYRGYGMSSGTPRLGTMLHDVKPIIDASGASHDKIVIFGRSVGSIYAIHAASVYPDCAGLIIESGIADPMERLLIRVTPEELGVPPQRIRMSIDRHIGHRRKLKKFNGSTLIMHSRNDGIVDLSHGKKLYEWANEPKQMKIFESGDHNSMMFVNAGEYFNTVGAFINGIKSEK